MIENLIEHIKNIDIESRYPLLRGELFILLLFIILSIIYNLLNTKKGFLKNFIILFESGFEKVYEFFDDILGNGQKRWVKVFIVGLFFIILFSNLTGSLIDFIVTMFPKFEGYIEVPSSNSNFNIAMSLITVFVILLLQFKYLGFIKFIYAYFPIFGKDVITIEKGNMNPRIYYPSYIFVKIFDIIISMFVGILDVIGNVAKVVSLSFRLTGNMMSGTILLGMAVAGMSALTNMLTNADFPIIFPLIIVLQGLLVAVIQAFVYALLTAIFIKVATE